MQERIQFNFHVPQSSWNFPQKNLVSIHAELFKWKEKLSQIETTHGLALELLESQTKALLNLTLRICLMLKFISPVTQAIPEVLSWGIL